MAKMSYWEEFLFFQGRLRDEAMIKEMTRIANSLEELVKLKRGGA